MGVYRNHEALGYATRGEQCGGLEIQRRYCPFAVVKIGQFAC